MSTLVTTFYKTVSITAGLIAAWWMVVFLLQAFAWLWPLGLSLASAYFAFVVWPHQDPEATEWE